MKRFSTSYSIREPQLDTTTCLLECPQSKTPATANAAEYVEQQELSIIARGNTKRHNHFGREFGQLLTKPNTLMKYSDCTPCYLPKWVGNVGLLNHLLMTVYSSFIHNCQNLEATKMSISRQMDKLWYIQAVQYYSVVKRNEPSSSEMTLRNLKCIFQNGRR